MSKRENIASDIITKLDAVTSPIEFKKITREPFEVEELTCVLGLSQKGIDFSSPDGQDCHLILLTLSPPNDPTKHRKFITRFRSMVQNSFLRSNLYESENRDEILNIISLWEEDDSQDNDLI